MNKITAVILCVATFIAGEVVGFLFGRSVGSRNVSVAVQSGADQIAQRLKAESELYDEIAKRSSDAARNAEIVSRIMWEKFDRLIALCVCEKILYESEKREVKTLYEELKPYLGEYIQMEYDSSTGKVNGLVSGSVNLVNPNVKKAREAYAAKIMKLRQKAANDAGIAAEKRMEYLKYSASK